MNEIKELRLAVLVDADNVPRNCIKAVMEEIAVYGTPTIKRIYGDWTGPHISGWKTSLLENALTPIQQYGYTVGKNSTDSAMIIDAMDILYADRVDGFCIVSSDSDFTRLALRLRESGKKVIGLGEKKTPKPFVVACDKFIYIEVIRETSARAAKSLKAKLEPEKNSDKPQSLLASSVSSGISDGIPDSIVELIATSLADIADDDGYAFMGELGTLLMKKQPDFDPRNFGYLKLTTLVKSIPRFEIDVRQTRDPNIKHIYLRDKQS
ncbi:MAG: NYN domain-containing protein [Oscillospiraceae bacterium]|nr:NYN domain-containing protein [Oscillospiraceae bacterium]